MPRASWDSRRSASMCLPAIRQRRPQQSFIRLAKEGYGIIYITERFCQELQEEMDRYVSERTPAIIPIPGVDGNFGIGIANVKKSVERAVGADILFGGDR